MSVDSECMHFSSAERVDSANTYWKQIVPYNVYILKGLKLYVFLIINKFVEGNNEEQQEI